jgi:membrane-associated phospholipid phosphatase
MAKATRITKKKTWLSIFTAEFLLVLILLFCIVVFAFATRMVFIEKKTDVDEAVFAFLKPYITPGRTSFMAFISFLGKHTLLIPLNFLLIGFFLYRKKKWLAIRIASLALSSLLLKFMLKLFFQRERPSIPVIEKVWGYSFPSGHALIGVVFYGLLIYVVWHEVKQKWLKTALISFFALLILFISFSRIYLRVHYASDVIAGLAVGIIWLVLSLRIMDRIEKRYVQQRLVKPGEVA